LNHRRFNGGSTKQSQADDILALGTILLEMATVLLDADLPKFQLSTKARRNSTASFKRTGKWLRMTAECKVPEDAWSSRSLITARKKTGVAEAAYSLGRR
jgi:hypothetical protein